MLLTGLPCDEAKFTPPTWSSPPLPHANTTHSVALYWHSYLELLNHSCLLESVGPGPIIAQCWHSAMIAAAKQLAYLVVAGERLGWIFIQGRGGQVDGVPVQTKEGAARAVLGVERTEVGSSRLAAALPSQLLTESP